MSFSESKKGYDKTEVDEFIARQKADYEGALARQKARIFELVNELESAQKTIHALKDKSELISKAIYNAVQKADEIERLSREKYFQEIEYLHEFHARWLEHYNRILQKYPLDNELKGIGEFNQKMSGVLARHGSQPQSPEQALSSEKQRVRNAQKGNKQFDPMERIAEYYEKQGAEKEGGEFSYFDAQNPKDDFKTIMQDLGFLIDD